MTSKSKYTARKNITKQFPLLRHSRKKTLQNNFHY